MAAMSLSILVARLPYMVLLALTFVTTIHAPSTTTCYVFRTGHYTGTRVLSLGPELGSFLGRGLVVEVYG